MASSAPTLTFPHPTLTPIRGKPTNSTLMTLRRQLYANARAVHSTRGGGANGHLGIIMPAAAYLARAQVAFNPPAHPGDAPAHAAGATNAQITETNRQYNQDINDHRTVITLKEELKKQILAAVDDVYMQALQDPEFGYADVPPALMLSHLTATYGTITREDIDKNRDALVAPWNPDQPIEDLYSRLPEIVRIATLANEPIAIATQVRALLQVIEATGVFMHATTTWRDKDDAEWTLENFKAHFTKANRERIRQLTAQRAGYHGANASSTGTSPPVDEPSLVDSNATTLTAEANAAAQPSIQPPPHVVLPTGTKMYYCWSHGLGKNSAHTSATCQNKKEGHQDEATADNLRGGANTIMGNRRRNNARAQNNDD